MTSSTELGHCTSNTAVKECIELPDSTTKIVDNNINNKITLFIYYYYYYNYLLLLLPAIFSTRESSFQHLNQILH